MIDINEEAKKALLPLDCKVVYQYPESFTGEKVVSYYNLAEKGAFYAWAKVPKECAELSIRINALMTNDGWTREMSMDVPKKDEKIYHRTMRFQKYFTLQ